MSSISYTPAMIFQNIYNERKGNEDWNEQAE